MSSNSLEEIYDYFKDIEGNVNLAKMKSKIEEGTSGLP